MESIPTNQELTDLLGKELTEIWSQLRECIEKNYMMECIWNSGGKAWNYELKYRHGGKTLCGLYAKEKQIGLLVIFGKEERARFESEQDSFPLIMQTAYNEATTYHDGKWVMFDINNAMLIPVTEKLLRIKRRPNKVTKA